MPKHKRKSRRKNIKKKSQRKSRRKSRRKNIKRKSLRKSQRKNRSRLRRRRSPRKSRRKSVKRLQRKSRRKKKYKLRMNPQDASEGLAKGTWVKLLREPGDGTYGKIEEYEKGLYAIRIFMKDGMFLPTNANKIRVARRSKLYKLPRQRADGLKRMLQRARAP